MNLLSSAKNFAAEQALRLLFRKHAGAYAELTELKVDTTARTARAVLLPKGPGERELDLNLAYEIVPPEKGEKTTLRVTRAESTRPWLQALARDHLVGQKFDLPPKAAALLG